MARLLLVEDDARIAKPLKRDLTAEMHVVDWVWDADSGLQQLSCEEYDLGIVDVLLPGFDGIELCRRARRQGVQTPLLLLTALDSTVQKVGGLDAGADDYLVKPFDLKELHARIRALIRRGSKKPVLLHWRGIQLNPALKVACFEGHSLDLTTREYQLLELFLRSPGRTFAVEEILDRVWGWEAPNSGTIKSHLAALRKKLGLHGVPNPIETLYGRGYRLADEG